MLLACVGHSLAEPNGERLLQFLWLCPQRVQGCFLISQPPFTQSCTHVRCLVHHSHKALLTCSIPFGTTIHTKLCSVEVPCSVQPFTQSCIHLRYPVHHHRQLTQRCIHLRYPVHHHNSHKDVFTCGILQHNHPPKAVFTFRYPSLQHGCPPSSGSFHQTPH